MSADYSKVPGKTISELQELTTVSGNERVPVSVYNEDRGTYMTYNITIDNFLKMLNERMTYIENVSNEASTYALSYIEELREVDKDITYKVAENAHGIVHLNNKTDDLTSYINAIYYRDSDDLFDDYSKEGDEVVLPIPNLDKNDD